MYLRLLLLLCFLNFRWCIIFFAVWCDAIAFWISSYSALWSFVLSIESVWSILSCFSLMILSQNITIWFINAKENLFRLENNLSIPGRNLQLLVQERVVHLYILLLMHSERKSLCETYRFNQFSLIANPSVLCFWPNVGEAVKKFRFYLNVWLTVSFRSLFELASFVELWKRTYYCLNMNCQ